MNYTEKNKLLDKISLIGLMAIFVEIFLYVIDRAYTGEISQALFQMQNNLYITGGVFIIISVILYVLAFVKSSKNKIIYATEFLVLAFLCPFLAYWYTRSGAPLNTIDPKNLGIIVLVYYVARILWECFSAYRNSSSAKLKKKKN